MGREPRRHARKHLGKALGLGCILAVCAPDVARADTPITANRPPSRGWLTLDTDRDLGFVSVEGFAMNMSLPRWGVSGDTASHRLVGVAAPSNASMFYGGRLGLTARLGSLLFEVAELSYMQTAGGSSLPAVANGETVQVSRDALHKLDVGMFGVGMQTIAPSGKAKLSMKVDWGWSTVWSFAGVSGGSQAPTSGAIGDQHWFVRSELAACARTALTVFEDARTWGCLTVASNVYEEGWLNGVAVGLRADF